MRKTVFITGASRGIGRAAALKFAKEDYNVVINCVNNRNMLKDVRNEVEAYGVSCLALCRNVGNYEQAEEMFREIQRRFTGVDILINNAGISHIGLFGDMDINQWNEVIESNLTSVFNCCKLAVPYMIQCKEGKIINISSVWGVAGASCEVAYSASKGGVNALTKALGKELAPSNIQVNAVACGVVDTDMNRQLTDDERIDLMDEIPAGRFATADETADFIYRLAIGNNYLTGQVIRFDGGWV